MNNENEDSNNEEDNSYDDDDDYFTDTSHKKKTYQVEFITRSAKEITEMQIDTINQVSTLLGKNKIKRNLQLKSNIIIFF